VRPMAWRHEEPDGVLTGRHPLIRKLAELTAELAGVGLRIVYPTASGWTQIHVDAGRNLEPAFCRLVRASPVGAKHCRLCHALMAVAACRGGPAERRCHAGACVMVCPAASSPDGSIAVISSSIFSGPEAWEEVRARGEQLGIELRALRKAFWALPKLTEQSRRLLRAAIEAMAQAVWTVRRVGELESELATGQRPCSARGALEEWIARNDWAPRGPDTTGHPVIHVVCELMRQRPDLPLTVKELAAAARLTPNHFTTLFRKRVGSSFTRYLTEQRIARAKKLLRNPTLRIKEIARQVG
jgi:AraC-like DNA-binding protein